MNEIKTETQVQIEEKKPYEQPAIIYRAPLEATAGSCGTSPGKATVGCTVTNS